MKSICVRASGSVLICALVISLLGMLPSAQGATYNWDGSQNYSYNTAGNWTTATVPGNTDNARFNSNFGASESSSWPPAHAGG